jgi:flagellin FlaB
VTGIDSGSSSNDGQVDTLEVTLSLAPGAGPVDLEDATFEYLGTSATTLPGTSGDISYVQVSGSSSPVLKESGDKIVAEIDIASAASQLDAGESADLTITTQDGGTSTVEVVVPDPDGMDSSGSSDEAVIL